MHLAESPKPVSQDYTSSQSEISPSVGFLLQTNDQNFDQPELLHWNSDDDIYDSFSSLFGTSHGILDWFDNDIIF